VSTTLDGKRRDWHSCGVVVLVAGLCYLAMYSGQWALGGSDDAYYLSIARNLVLGRGFTWQGAPVVLVPPGWPLFLSVALRVTPSFAFLNSLTLLLCMAAAGLWYWILRDLTSRRRAMVAAIVAITIFEWHRFSNTLYAESLFFLLLSAMLLLALQVRRGRSISWRLPLILGMCAAAVAVRYAALLLVPLVAAAMLPPRLLDDRRPVAGRRLVARRRLAAAAMVVAVAVAAYVGLRAGIQAVAEVRLQHISRPQLTQEATEALSRETRRASGAFSKGLWATLESFAQGGRWMSRVLWPPAVAGTLVPGGKVAVNVLGWTLLLLLGVRTFHGLRRGEWVWGGAVAYCLFLFAWSSKPIPRYLSPIAPLLVLGVWGGFRVLRVNFRSSALRRAASLGAAGFLVAVLLCNGAIWAVNAWVAHSSDPVNRTLAGEYGELVAIAGLLRRENVNDGEVAVFVEYQDLVRHGKHQWVRRVLNCLMDRRIGKLPAEAYALPPQKRTAEYARSAGIRFVVSPSRHRPSRIWHIPFPSPYGEEPAQRARGGERSYYALWAIEEDGCRRVSAPRPEDGLRRLPGL